MGAVQRDLAYLHDIAADNADDDPDAVDADASCTDAHVLQNGNDDDVIHGETVMIPAEDDDDDDGYAHLSINDRPTIPVPAPRDSGVRLRVAQVEWPAATIDVVLCDLSRDPRSEDFTPDDLSTVRRSRHPRRARRLFA